MTATMDRHTVLPPEGSEQLKRLSEAMAGGMAEQPARLVGPDGSTSWELPAEVYDVLRQVVQALADGLAITVAPLQTMLTTQETADLLGISRPTLVRLLEAGEIPCSRVDRHRRITLAEALEYRQRSRERNRARVREMTRDGEEAGMHEIAAEPRSTR